MTSLFQITWGTSSLSFIPKINLIALKEAMHSLTPKAFELWLYFSKNQNGYSFYLSKVDFLNWSNIASTSYYNAFNELVKGNYLIPVDKENQEPKRYNFFEIPREEEKEKKMPMKYKNKMK